MYAVQARITATGGPDAIKWQTVELAEPRPGEAVMRNEAVGLNFIDVYHRKGIYPLHLPSGLGLEAAGRVETVGSGIRNVTPGDRVAIFNGPLGAYANRRIVPGDRLVPLPEEVPSEAAAALMLKGCTAECLIERCARIGAGASVLVHAAAGATGRILVQWLRHVGATVIGTAGDGNKAHLAAEAGAQHVSSYDPAECLALVAEVTGGRGVDVVLDGVGASTWQTSLKACCHRGLIVSFGNSGGVVAGISLADLAANGSLFVTRPTMMEYYADPEEFASGTARVLDMIATGAITPGIGQRFGLFEAGKAHALLEARRTVGATVLLP